MNAQRWLIGLCALAAAAEAAARDKDPRVPPGRDPGGIAVALVSTGVDYTLPQVASRLARDGEGEVIGWDFADGDALPFDTSQGRSSTGRDGTALASLVLTEAPGARLVPVRIGPDQPGSLARAVAFVGQTPARIVLITGGGSGREDWELFRQAAQHFRQLLVIVATDGTARPLVTAAAGLDNVLIAGASSSPGAELVIETPAPAAAQSGDSTVQLPDAAAAAARAVGRAAEEAARSPGLDGAGLKRALVPR
ncbi:MAG: hypothetical protein KJZ80_12055 [Hyphomicrobiaceae bacterium]|nr:hypothetical protein [Hyphomicrobiaceae bacterium]